MTGQLWRRQDKLPSAVKRCICQVPLADGQGAARSAAVPCGREEVPVLNDKKIISAIANRDEQMLAFVVQKYSRLLWKIAAPILINAASVQDVEECVADVFIYLWQYPEKYDPDKAKLSSWLSVIARSRAVDRYRQIIRKREISMDVLPLRM